MRATDRSARRRRGFTLVELLVVIAIIGVLVSLTGVTVFRLIGTQQANNTKSELSRLEGELQKEYRAAADKFAKEPIPTTGPLNTVYYGTVLPMAGNDPNRARVIWVKLRLKQTFPDTFNEALNPVPMPPLPYYQSVLGALGYTVANTTAPQAWESGGVPDAGPGPRRGRRRRQGRGPRRQQLLPRLRPDAERRDHQGPSGRLGPAARLLPLACRQHAPEPDRADEWRQQRSRRSQRTSGIGFVAGRRGGYNLFVQTIAIRWDSRRRAARMRPRTASSRSSPHPAPTCCWD